jgi:nitrate reductase NapE component
VYRHAEFFAVRLDSVFEARVPPERARFLFVVACYHLVAYASAVVGSVGLCVWVAWKRTALAPPA